NLAGAMEPSTLRSVVISHLHPDHYIDLVPLRHYLLWDFDPARRVAVLGPTALADRLAPLHDEPGFAATSLGLAALPGEPGFGAPALDIADLGGDGERQLGGLPLEARRIRHTNDSYGFRVSSGTGPGLVYSGDCG